MTGGHRPQSEVGGYRPQLRPYQLAADAAIDRELARVRSTLLVMATGTGKTTSFVERTRRCKLNGGRTLILADRDELIRQPQRKLEAIGIVADIEKARERAGLSAKVVIASVQSLRGARLTRFPRDHFDLVIADEADLAMGPSWRAIIDHFATAKLLGVTATPIRADGQALGEIFESVAYRYEIRDAIRDGYLAPIVARRVVLDGIDLSAVKTRGGDLAQDQLAAILETERAISGVVVPLLELARDRPTVVFGVDIKHAEALADALNDRRPGCARAVSGDTAQDDRRGLLEAYERGEFQFLCNCALLCRGWDAPHTSCVAIARPTKSWALACQMAGRGTRLSPETGKRDCLLLHFTGAAGKHRLIGPADCLAGSQHGPDALADDVREEIDRLLGTQQLELERVFASADAEVAKRRAQIAKDAMVRFHAAEIDPFIGDDDHEGALHVTTRPEPGMFTRPPSDAQLRALDKIGVTVKQLPAAFSMADASRLLGRHAARRARGLCSLAQAKRIAQGTNIDTRAMTFERAKELCTMLRHGSWRPQALFCTPEYISAANARAHDTKRLIAPAGVAEKATGLRQDESGDAPPSYGSPIAHSANHELVDGAA